MTESDLLLNEIKAIEGCERTKRKIMAILHTQLGRRIYFAKGGPTKERQVSEALKLLNAGHDRTEARQAIEARFGLGRTAATEVVNAAIEARRPVQQEVLF